MKFSRSCLTLLGVMLGAFLSLSCKKEHVPPPLNAPSVNSEKLIRNLFSDFSVSPYFKLSTGEIVSNPQGDNWDLNFQDAQIKINGGNMSNPIRTGNAKGILINAPYSSIKEIPALSNLKQDNGKNEYALGYRSGGQSWYYMDDLFFMPYTEKTLFVQTADNKGFAKIQILSFYRNMPSLKGETHESMASRTRYYTFRYQYIENGQKFH